MLARKDNKKLTRKYSIFSFPTAEFRLNDTRDQGIIMNKKQPIGDYPSS